MADFPTVDSASAFAKTTADRPVTSLDARPPQTPEQVRALAVQFESILLAQMLKDMRDSMFDSGEESSGFGAGPLGDSLFQEFSIALSRAGGIGLGQSLMAPLEAAAGVAAAGPTFVTAAPQSLVNAAGSPAALDRPSPLTSTYGWRRDPISGAAKFHKGIDLAMPVGDDVPAARAGEVVSAGDLAGYGKTVVVKHSDTTSTRYAHLSEILVKPGDTVVAGQTIARSGVSGRATGPHLHFEVLQEGRSVDPYGTW
jgi:murein DD-endopeptidase MepM/ murein hydrolase activator NlpD